MIDLNNEVPFGLGDKVSHSKYGNGQIIGVDFGALTVLFDNGAVKTFYDDAMPDEEATHKIGELKYVGEWVSINWDDKSTFPDIDDLIIVKCGHDLECATLKYDAEYGYIFELNNGCDVEGVTHWMHMPRLPDNKE